jgi:cysteine-rich repeat protein
VCRAAASDCDVVENCTGSSADCPADSLEPDGTSCNDTNVCTIDDECQAGVCGGDPGPAGTATCGDDVVQAVCGETCDDGNLVDCDGCSSSCEEEDDGCGKQSSRQRKCVNSLNRSLLKVWRAQSRDVRTCIRSGRELSGSIETCVNSDLKGRVAVAVADTELSEIGKCIEEPPAFGATDAVTVNDSGIRNEIELIHDVFGPDLDAVIIAAAQNKPGFNCQKTVVKMLTKCQEVKLRQFNKCKAKGLRTGDVTHAATLRTSCLGADPLDRVSRVCDPETGRILTGTIKPCLGTDLSDAFPGCATDDIGELAACLDSGVECHVCLALAEVDGFSSAVCDRFDNGSEDGSCGALQPGGSLARCGPGFHWVDGPCEAGFHALTDTTGFAAIDLDLDCFPDLSLPLLGDVILERSGPIDRSINFPGPADCNGSPCGFVNGHLDVIDTEIVSLSLTGGGVGFRAGQAAAIPLLNSLGTLVEQLNHVDADSFFDVFLEIEVDGVRLYNHDPIQLQVEINSFPPDETYVHSAGCIPLFDQPVGGVQIGALVEFTHDTNPCGNNVAGDSEQCDGIDDAACPGQCQADCACP